MDDLNNFVWNAERLRSATDAAGIALWAWNVDTNALAMDERGYSLWRIERGASLTFDSLTLHIYPPDVEHMKALIEATRHKPGPYEIDFRIMRSDEVRWVNARGLGADEGMVGRLMFGTFMDVTERREAEEARELLAGEMSHRVKNLFLVASSLTSISARSARNIAEMQEDLVLRFNTLGQAHELLRRDGHESTTSIAALLTVLLGSYDVYGVVGGRIRLTCGYFETGKRATTALALIVHELATNSVKYGALSTTGGSLQVGCFEEGDVVGITWEERGSPTSESQGRQSGYGTKLISRSVSGALGGTVAYDWLSDGLNITLRMQKERLAA